MSFSSSASGGSPGTFTPGYGPSESPDPNFLLFNDDLTGLYNRRYYDRCFVEQAARARESGNALGLLVIDVDFFKSINDRMGHHQGDEILAGVGAIIHHVIDRRGYPARYGGDEFVVVLPLIEREEALSLARRLCEEVRSHRFKGRSGSQDLHVTLSIGAAHFPGDTPAPESLFEHADAALCQAKRAGRNRVLPFEGGQDVAGEPAWSGNFPCPRLIGREDILEEADGCLRQPDARGMQWVVLRGQPGVGKSRLLQDLRERATSHSFVVLAAAGSPLRREQPFGLLLDAVAGAVRENPPLAQAVAASLSRTELRQIASLVPDLARYALLEVSARSFGEIAGPHDPDEPARDRAVDPLCKILASLSARSRTLLLLDDFHHADTSTLQVLERLVSLAPGLVTWAALRDDVETLPLSSPVRSQLERLEKERALRDLCVAPLTPAQVREMLEALLCGAGSHEDLVRLVCERSRGLPLLIEEVLRSLLYQKHVSCRGGVLESVDLADLDLPSTDELLLEIRMAQAIPARSVAVVSPRSPDGRLRRGAVLNGRYQIEEVLAPGGMSLVYRATVIPLAGKQVAIKEMISPFPNAVLRQKAVEQFRTEARTLARLDHPNLVQVLDYFEEHDGHYFVMAYVEGRTLQQVLDSTRIEVGKVLAWLDQLCSVLGYLHAQKPPVLFRDLKPNNIMLDAHGTVRLIDFGIAHTLDPEGGTSTYLHGAGTAGFAPVEQCGGGTTDQRSDIYALGATVYALLTGLVPPPSVAIQNGHEPLVFPRDLNPEVPEALQTLVLRMMAVFKEDRPSSMDEVREALREIHAQKGTRSVTALEVLPVASGPAPGLLRPTGQVLRVTAGAAQGASFALEAREITLGRGDRTLSTATRICLDEPSVSRSQATLRWDDKNLRYVIFHEATATNATQVNGQSITRSPLAVGDVLRVGHLEARLEQSRVGTRDEGPRTEAAIRPAAPLSDATGQETTGAWCPEVACMFKVVSGDPADVGQVHPVAPAAFVEGKEIRVGGVRVVPRDITLHDDALTTCALTLQVRGGRLQVIAATRGPAARVNGQALPRDGHALSRGDCISWGLTTLIFFTGEECHSSPFALERLTLQERRLVASFDLSNTSPLLIGRQEGVEIRLDDPGVSRRHALLELRDGGWWIKHLSQTNPTLVNGVRLQEPRLLAHGDEIQVCGSCVLRFVEKTREY